MTPTKPLFTYQQTGAEWLSEKKFALLCDEMGLGKTRQVIEALRLIEASKILIICPAIARITWRNEFLKWSESITPHDIQILETKRDLPNSRAKVLICSFDYATVSEDKKQLRLTKRKTPPQNPYLKAWCENGGSNRAVMVVDESHFLKSLEARRTEAILGRDGVIRNVSRAWFLTGTPMPNAPHELWPILYTAGKTPLDYNRFMREFCQVYSFNGRDVPTGARRERIPQLRELLKPIMLRRMKKDVLSDLPKVIYGEVLVEPSITELPVINEEQKALLSVLTLTDPLDQIRALEVHVNSISTLRRYCALQKVNTASELIAGELEAKSYRKIVIFCIHKEIVSKMAGALARFNPVVVNGEVSADARQRAIESFQNQDGCRVFIGNIKAAGTNITLTASDQMVFIEEDYVPGNNDQAVARCNRIGQTSVLNVRYIRLTNSIDQKINEILTRKSTDQRLLLGVI